MRNPNEMFAVVIWGCDRHKFNNPPEASFRDKRICVTGVIKTYRSRRENIVRDPDQITLRPK